jgi:hypothetical protein
LNAIGHHHEVGADFYQRHLDYQTFTSTGRNFFTSPGLPSMRMRVFQLPILTICTRNVLVNPYEPENLKEERRSLAEAMRKYFNQLRDEARIGDSVVRKCLILSRRVYVVEQVISVQVLGRGDSWRAAVWLDSGRDLSRSVHGPWIPPAGAKAWETFFHPVIVERERNEGAEATSRTMATRMEELVGNAETPASESWAASQNMALLPYQYGDNLDRSLAAKDALYALSELISFAASAQAQFLNLVQERIEHELSFVGSQGGVNAHDFGTSLVNLRYIKTHLASHMERLAEISYLLQNRRCVNWPRVPESELAEKTATLLVKDYEFLTRRAQGLAEECQHGIATLANSCALEESRLSANNAAQVHKLTVLATIFVPLSFLCGVWGMNFEELGSGRLHVWWWFVTAFPVLLLALFIYYFEGIVAIFDKMKSTRGQNSRRDELQ